MRISLRSLGITALAVFAAACSDAPSRPAQLSSKGRLAIAPVFSKEAAAVFARREQFAAVEFDHVRITLTRASGAGRGDKVVDTTIVFTPSSASVNVDLTVDVERVGDPFDVTVEYTSNGNPVFRGTQTVESHALDATNPNIAQITVTYVGVGATAKSVAIPASLRNTTLQHPSVTVFSATVTDQAGNQMGEVPVSWTSSNPAVATIIGSTGVLTTAGRGTTTLTVSTPTGLTDNTTLTVGLPASKFEPRSGGGQTGGAGTSLLPITIRALATDNLPVAGVAVSITAPTGGNATPANGTTNASGDFTFTPTLGGALGTQNFVATAVSPSGTTITLTITATATAGSAASIQALSGNNQADTIRLALKQPFVARVLDQFGNGVPGVTVAWARTAGSGSVAAASSTTNSSGDAVMTYTLGSTVGAEQVTATASGVTNGAIFSASALAAGPADIVIVSGNTQTGKALLPLDKQFVAVVVDRVGASVAGATVTWTATNGSLSSSTTVSDAQGQVRNTLTLAGKLGAASATATIANGKAITFGATVRPGIPTHLTYRTQPSNAVAGVAIAPAIAVELRDGADNIATDDDANIALALSANPGAATLSGTSTRRSITGVATFDNISLDKAAIGYALVGISGTLPQLVSAPFNISPAGPAKISIVAGNNQTATVNTAVATAPSVRVADTFDNDVPNQVVHFAPVTGSGTANPTDVTTNGQGIATLTSWVLGTAVGPKSMVVSLPSATSVQTVTFVATAIAGQATALAITTQPSATAIAGTALAVQPVIQLQDTYGNPTAVGAPITITATASSGAGSATNNTATAVTGSGTATFNGLTLNTRATVTLSFSAAPLTSVVSNPIAVSAGNPQAIALACTDNQTATVNTPVATAPCVRVTDAQGNLVPGAAVVFAPSGGSGSVTQGTVVTDAQGLAGAGQWTLGTGVGAQSLDVSMRDFASVGHVTFHATAIAGQASKLVMVRQPSTTGIAGVALAVQPIVQMQDQFNNPTGLGAPAGGIVATSSAGAATGNVANPNATGLATFASLALRTTGTQTVTFSGSGLQPVASQAIAIGPAGVASLQIVSGNNQNDTVTAFLPLPATVRALDAFGNVVPGVPVTFVPSGDGAVSASPVATNAQGTASTTWRLGSVAGTQTLAAGAPGATGVQFSAFARAGAPTRIAFGPNFPTTGIQGVSLNPSIVVVLSDRFGNQATGSFDQVVIRDSDGESDLISASGLSRQAVNGVATFNGVAIPFPGTHSIIATAPQVNGGVSVVSLPITITAGRVADATTDAPDQITATSANLKGHVNQDGAQYDIWFEYGTSPGLDSFFSTGIATAIPTAPGAACPGTITCLWNIVLGFAPGTTNYYRIAVSNGGGTIRGAIVSFITPTTAPATGGSLNRSVDPCVNSGTPAPPSSKPTSRAAGSTPATRSPCVTLSPETGVTRRP